MGPLCLREVEWVQVAAVNSEETDLDSIFFDVVIFEYYETN